MLRIKKKKKKAAAMGCPIPEGFLEKEGFWSASKGKSDVIKSKERSSQEGENQKIPPALTSPPPNPWQKVASSPQPWHCLPSNSLGPRGGAGMTAEGPGTMRQPGTHMRPHIWAEGSNGGLARNVGLSLSPLLFCFFSPWT